MTSLLWFALALAAIVLIGWTVSKLTGSRSWPVDEWAFDEGEVILWRDDAADVTLIPKLGQAVSMTPIRLRRWKVIATNRRVLLAQKALGGRHIVSFVLYPGVAPGGDSAKVGGGLLTTGYVTLVILPGVAEAHPEDGYVTLRLDPGVASSANLVEIRIYSELAGTIQVP